MLYDNEVKLHVLEKALAHLAKHVQYGIADNKTPIELVDGDIFFEVTGSRITGNTPTDYHRQSDVYRYRCNLFWDTKDVVSPINLTVWPVYVDAKTGDFKEDQQDKTQIIFNKEKE